MSVHVLLKLLHELGKRDKMRGLQSILWLFRKKFNKFNNTGPRMLDFIYQRTFKLCKCENVKKSSYFMQCYNGRLTITLLNQYTTSGLLILLHILYTPRSDVM